MRSWSGSCRRNQRGRERKPLRHRFRSVKHSGRQPHHEFRCADRRALSRCKCGAVRPSRHAVLDGAQRSGRRLALGQLEQARLPRRLAVLASRLTGSSVALVTGITRPATLSSSSCARQLSDDAVVGGFTRLAYVSFRRRASRSRLEPAPALSARRMGIDHRLHSQSAPVILKGWWDSPRQPGQRSPVSVAADGSLWWMIKREQEVQKSFRVSSFEVSEFRVSS